MSEIDTLIPFFKKFTGYDDNKQPVITKELLKSIVDNAFDCGYIGVMTNYQRDYENYREIEKQIDDKSIEEYIEEYEKIADPNVEFQLISAACIKEDNVRGSLLCKVKDTKFSYYDLLTSIEVRKEDLPLIIAVNDSPMAEMITETKIVFKDPIPVCAIPYCTFSFFPKEDTSKSVELLVKTEGIMIYDKELRKSISQDDTKKTVLELGVSSMFNKYVVYRGSMVPASCVNCIW